MKSTNMLLLGAVAIGAYLIVTRMKPAPSTSATAPQSYTGNPAVPANNAPSPGQPAAQPNAAASIIASTGSAITSISDSLQGWF